MNCFDKRVLDKFAKVKGWKDWVEVLECAPLTENEKHSILSLVAFARQEMLELIKKRIKHHEEECNLCEAEAELRLLRSFLLEEEK